METITPEILLQAYAMGLFPMGESADDRQLGWYDPNIRAIFPLHALKISRSLAKTARAEKFEIRVDHDFDAIIDACAQPRHAGASTWINGEIRRLYRALFDRGAAHTIEVWRAGRLVGGLYGVSLRAAFFGESMFHRETDASKIALVHLVARLRAGGFQLLDAQMPTPHLMSLGAIELPRAQYKAKLREALRASARFPDQDNLKLSGAQAVDLAATGAFTMQNA